jgi:15-cis-phytoene synthase
MRDRLRWLLQFDCRLQQVVERASEPLFAQMRLAWWRDALGKAAKERPRGEPLLAAFAEFEGDGALVEAAQRLVDAAELRAADDGQKGALERALAICTAVAEWTNADRQMAERLAFAWAGQGDAALTSFPRNLRPLTILAMAQRLESGAMHPGWLGPGLRLSWHALTGR